MVAGQESWCLVCLRREGQGEGRGVVGGEVGRAGVGAGWNRALAAGCATESAGVSQLWPEPPAVVPWQQPLHPWGVCGDKVLPGPPAPRTLLSEGKAAGMLGAALSVPAYTASWDAGMFMSCHLCPLIFGAERSRKGAQPQGSAGPCPASLGG